MNNIISFRVILCVGILPQPPSTHNVTFVQGMAYIVDRYITDIIKTL